ncbi:ABC-2 transporter permease [Rummeliibacillus pycnus]|uniref:ABC-2 transporter permease n=1 Tax=Rummeliibacillus pycnus TaxID=101070 RepID=UPI0037C5E148
MKTLLLKDFYMLKTHFIILFGMSLIAIVLSFVTSFGAGLAFPIVFVAVMVLGNLMTLDQQFKWERVVCTLPIETEKLILSKYFLASIVAIFPATVAVAVLWFSVHDTPNFILPLWALIVASILFIAAITLPASIRFGQEKGRLVMVLVFLIPWLLCIKFVDTPMVRDFLNNPGDLLWLSYLYLGFVILLIIISYYISVKIYKKQDW